MEELEGVVNDIVDQKNDDHQVLVEKVESLGQVLEETVEKVENLETLMVERFNVLEKSLTPEEVSRWQAVLKRLKNLIVFLTGGVTINILYAALVQDETLETRLQQLGRQADQILDRLKSPPVTPEILSEPTPTIEPTPTVEPTPEPIEQPTSKPKRLSNYSGTTQPFHHSSFS